MSDLPFGAPPSLRVGYRTFESDSALWRYSLAILAVALVFLFRLALNPVMAESASYLPFVLAIVVSAWRGGMGPGVLATISSALISDYYFVQPLQEVNFFDLSDLGVWILVLLGVLISWLSEQRLRNECPRT
jgi:K+-sensing histidine kinase KdpD